MQVRRMVEDNESNVCCCILLLKIYVWKVHFVMFIYKKILPNSWENSAFVVTALQQSLNRDFILWGYLKSKVFENRFKTLWKESQHLRQNFTDINALIWENVLGNYVPKIVACKCNHSDHLNNIMEVTYKEARGRWTFSYMQT